MGIYEISLKLSARHSQVLGVTCQYSLQFPKVGGSADKADDRSLAGRRAESEQFIMARVAYSADVDQIRGKVGTNVFSKARSGPTLRIRRSPRASNTPAQAAIKRAMTRSSRSFKAMTISQEAAWKAYANTINRTNSLNGDVYHPAAIDAFNELSIKFLQINPVGTVPLVPPTTTFDGDTITVTAMASTGQVTFTASAANTSGIKTELLAIPVPSPHRTLTPSDYRTLGFFTFVAGTLTKSYALPLGWAGIAYRFVNPTTGQASALIPLPMVQIPGP